MHTNFQLLQLEVDITAEDDRLASKLAYLTVRASTDAPADEHAEYRVDGSGPYVLSRPATDAFRKLRFQFLNKNQPPAGTMLPFEGLPSADASMGIDVVAALNR